MGGGNNKKRGREDPEGPAEAKLGRESIHGVPDS